MKDLNNQHAFIRKSQVTLQKASICSNQHKRNVMTFVFALYILFSIQLNFFNLFYVSNYLLCISCISVQQIFTANVKEKKERTAYVFLFVLEYDFVDHGILCKLSFKNIYVNVCFCLISSG